LSRSAPLQKAQCKKYDAGARPYTQIHTHRYIHTDAYTHSRALFLSHSRALSAFFSLALFLSVSLSFSLFLSLSSLSLSLSPLSLSLSLSLCACSSYMREPIFGALFIEKKTRDRGQKQRTKPPKQEEQDVPQLLHHLSQHILLLPPSTTSTRARLHGTQRSGTRTASCGRAAPSCGALLAAAVASRRWPALAGGRALLGLATGLPRLREERVFRGLKRERSVY
jgi:hypothetical protein